MRATLLIFWQRTRKELTAWRRGGDSNPRDPFESTRVPGVRLKPGSATSPRETRLCITPPRGATLALDRAALARLNSHQEPVAQTAHYWRTFDAAYSDLRLLWNQVPDSARRDGRRRDAQAGRRGLQRRRPRRHRRRVAEPRGFARGNPQDSRSHRQALRRRSARADSRHDAPACARDDRRKGQGVRRRTFGAAGIRQGHARQWNED